jgi:hypothetical protein
MNNKKTDLCFDAKPNFSNQQGQTADSPTLINMNIDPLDIWLKKYHQSINNAIQILNTNTSAITKKNQSYLFKTLKAERFLQKFNGDKTATLNWTIVEEKRQLIRMFINKVTISKGSIREKIITPQLSFDIPEDVLSQITTNRSQDI